ncbi:MAG: hypothetical protein VX498_15380 [Myxococcota bacterium]|nr:hypothetical protein [Myxococcota bacterium]
MVSSSPLPLHLPATFLVGLLSLGPLSACGSPVGVEVAVVQELSFIREEPEGISDAFDLDGRESDADDPEGCYVSDLVDLEGNAGIDNAFSNILPALELTEAAALEPLIQAAIDEGRLLLMLEMAGLDARDQDDCVDLRLSRGLGPPALGGDGKLLPGQTFDRAPDAPESLMSCADLREGVLTGRPLDMRLPLQVFDESIDISMFDGIFEIELLPEFGYRGRFAGGIDIVELMDNVYSFDGVGDEVPSLLETVLDANADLAPDASGVCRRLSVAFRFDAVSAYFFED